MNETDDVRVENAGGQWVVVVVEGGRTSRREFETEQFARNYADGQRLRFGLPAIDRVPPVDRRAGRRVAASKGP